jgi:hypothetical protein
MNYESFYDSKWSIFRVFFIVEKLAVKAYEAEIFTHSKVILTSHLLQLIHYMCI